MLRDAHHPSIVAWVPMNESFGLGPSPPAAFLDHLYELTHTLDGTRPVMSSDGWEHATSDLFTLHDYGSAQELAARYRTLETALVNQPHPIYLPGHAYHGEPIVVSEFGGVALAGAGGFGWNEASGPAALVTAYREMVAARMGAGPVEGFCYTQLTDIEQEKNGLLAADRQPKVDPAVLRQITQTPKQR